MAGKGSSPRMRGTLFLAGVDGDDLGIIPAYAGNTISSSAYPAWCQDHPRVCGEHLDPACGGRMFWGSSPRMRGTPSGIQTLGTTVRIIPAYAGNTSIEHRKRRWNWDHPRVCGEHHENRRISAPRLGSSPRMRGTQDLRARVGINSGIIPAYAGNTSPIGFARMLHRDHPRVCGEHQHRAPETAMELGSSPRMRGTRRRSAIRTRTCGIIPAYAGNTLLLSVAFVAMVDHPRVCGEHSAVKWIRAMWRGSSPRMRGTPLTACL